MTENLIGIWADDTANYLTDLRHPVMRREWAGFQLRLGYVPPAAMPLRERRQFDREMVAKYGDFCPPPARTEWHLKVYDILDAQEERAVRERAAVLFSKKEVVEEVYIDEAI